MNDSKKPKIVKLAVLRTNDSNSCPFGLSIPFGCHNAGDLVLKMAPLDLLGEDASDEECKEISDANNFLLRWQNPKRRCIHASKLFENRDVVECSWDSSTLGAGESGVLVGSPFFYRHFSGIGLDGLYTYPLGYYTDNSIDRGMYYGMYSIESTGQDENASIKGTNDNKKKEKP